MGAFGLAGWWRSKAPVFRFVALFLLIVVLFYAISKTPIMHERVYPAYLALSAEVAGWTLGLIGRDVEVHGTMISGPHASVTVQIGCDATEPIVLLLATMLAFPAPWRARLLGAAIGLPTLLGLNVVRIASLYETRVHRPEWFDTLHVQVWQPAFIVAVLLIWITWIGFVTNRPTREPPDAATDDG